MSFGLTTLVRVEAGEPVVMLGGVHTGCYELFATGARAIDPRLCVDARSPSRVSGRPTTCS